MTKPISFEQASDDSSNSQDKREQDLTMLHYIRNMNVKVGTKAKRDNDTGVMKDDFEFDAKSESVFSEVDDVMTIHDNWGGTDEFALRTAVFVSFLKVETFRHFSR
jgi:hypothetical protein